LIYSKGLSKLSPNEPKKKVLFGQDSSERSSRASGLNQTTIENKEIGNYDTIDALPNIDYYRNIFSFTSSEPKTRPTLEVLHGTVEIPSKFKLASSIDLNSEMISSITIPNEQSGQIEIKSKTEIVKFGWIIGVLVCFFLFFHLKILNVHILDSLCIEYIWCYVIPSSIMGYRSSWNWSSMCNNSHINSSYCFNIFINECYLYKW